MKDFTWVTIMISLLGSIRACSDDCYNQAKINHHVRGVSYKEIEYLSNLLQVRSNLKDIFNNVNLVRPVGSKNHAIVREYIKSFLTTLQWDVEEDRFTKDTVIGPQEFVNIIGTQNPSKTRRLVLACHYDSLMKEGFQTSTDSAMPCSLMLSIAEVLNPFLKNNWKTDLSLELIFFDGEEAFIKWNKDDSLYGSRHLAQMWESDLDECYCSKLKRIETLILLDLLGYDEPKFFNFNSGNRYFDSLQTIEKRIKNRSLFRDDSGHPYFQSYSIKTNIEDDHIPFMERGVPYVHLITVPFPAVWHTVHDNANNINWSVSRDLELIITVFLSEFFHLPIQESSSQVIYQTSQIIN